MKYIYLLLITLTASCTVTKRVHQPGYSIQWRGHLNHNHTSEQMIDPTPSQDEELPDERNIQSSHTYNEQSEKNENIEISQDENEVSEPMNQEKVISTVHDQKVTTESINNESNTTSYPKPISNKQGEKSANLSLGFSFASMVLALLSIFTIPYDLFGLFILLIVLGFIFAIMGLISGLRSMNSGNNDQSVKVKHSLGVIFSILMILICGFLLIFSGLVGLIMATA